MSNACWADTGRLSSVEQFMQTGIPRRSSFKDEGASRGPKERVRLPLFLLRREEDKSRQEGYGEAGTRAKIPTQEQKCLVS